jgi:hypothetical protein
LFVYTKILETEKLLKLGISEDLIISYSQLLCHFLWSDWIEKEIEDFNTNRQKYSIIPALNRHPIASNLHGATVESAVEVVRLWKCLELLSNDKNIHTYSSRLKSFRDVNPAVFEIEIARSLQNSWFKLEWLQLLNPDKNPVEIVTSFGGKRFWFECKSVEKSNIEESYYKQILRVLEKENEQLCKKWNELRWVAFLFRTNKPIINQEDCNIIKKSIKWVMSNVYSLKKSDYCTLIKLDHILSGLEVLIYELNNENHGRVVNDILFNQGWVEWWWTSYVKASKSNSSLPNSDYLQEKSKCLIFTWYEHKFKKENKIISSDFFRAQIREKIKQQKSLLNSWEEVVIVFDNLKSPDYDTCLQTMKRIGKQENLSILLARKPTLSTEPYIILPLQLSKNFPIFL